MKDKLYFWLALTAISASASTLPFMETFDGLTNNVSINNQNGWVLSSGSSATIQSIVVTTNSSKSLRVQNSQVLHSLSNTETSVWASFQARITDAPSTSPTVTNANTSIAFFVNTNLNLVVYNGTNQVELTNVQMPINEWVRFGVFCDYNINVMKWMLSVNGTNVAADLDFYSTNSQIESVLFANETSTSAYLDELAIQDTEPASGTADTDGDMIPDWWEQLYFGNVTNILATGTASNGMSYLDVYIAGLNPNDANAEFNLDRITTQKFSWSRQTGRQYDIYWTSNLTSGFTLIYTNITASEFEDTDTARTAEAARFYQVRVHK